ncbi:MAG TPA: dephospho-CoA kinase [Gemmatimonadaceae bacterium]|jgi:dephospho-CoA kinase|nr:dephospho-CoA kinase [Gemmatimonadaceae bacterium]
MIAGSVRLVPLGMLLIGLTGNIASGKSTVARLLSERGATIIDADVLARRVVEPGMPAFDEIVRRWGKGVVDVDGNLDREALRRLVFSNHEELEELNRIVHPEVAAYRDRLVNEARQRGDRLVVCDIPLLFERGLVDDFDRIVLVDAPRPVRLERLMRERGLSETEAMDMMTAQMPAELKRARADYVIDNMGTVRELEERVSEVWQALEREADAQRATSAVS